MVAIEEFWPNEAGFDTDYEQHEPVQLTVKGIIPYYVAGILCKSCSTDSKRDIRLTIF
jgi:torulene dioxygenase